MTRRDRAIRHARAKLAIAERLVRDARAVLAGESYDDAQLAAVLSTCVRCGRRTYQTVPHPACTACREQGAA